MDQMTISPAMLNQMAGVAGNGMTLRGLQGLLGGGMEGGDIFAVIFQQLMMGMGEGEIQTLFDQLGMSTGEDDEPQNIDLAMQMMAEMLYSGNPQVQALFEQMTGEAVQDVTAAPQQQMAVPVQQQNQQPQQTQQSAQPEVSFEQLLGQAQAVQNEGASGQELMQGQYLFQNAVAQAKAQMDGEETQPQLVDIDALQADVNAGRFAPVVSTQQVKLPQQVDTADVVEQMRSSILSNLSRHNNEFVVRLQPEGLGEITVKMLERKEGIVLSIIASSTDTARLITNEVASLQNALRPLNAQVQEVVTVPQAAETAAQQNALNDQNLHQQQQMYQQQHSNSHADDRQSGSFEDAVWEQQVLDDVLDTYI